MNGYCGNCGLLDRSKIERAMDFPKLYHYGCKRNGKFCCGWIVSDSELRYMGCSFWQPEPQYENVSIFDDEENSKK